VFVGNIHKNKQIEKKRYLVISIKSNVLISDDDLLAHALCVVACHVDSSSWKDCHWFGVEDAIVDVFDCDAFWKPVKLDSSPVKILFQVSSWVRECLISTKGGSEKRVKC
jgi:hypothetical protein